MTLDDHDFPGLSALCGASGLLFLNSSAARQRTHPRRRVDPVRNRQRCPECLSPLHRDPFQRFSPSNSREREERVRFLERGGTCALGGMKPKTTNRPANLVHMPPSKPREHAERKTAACNRISPNKGSLMNWTIFFEKWMPAMITGIIGGLVVSLLVPYAQNNFALTRELSVKKVEVFSAINDAFVAYVYAREQLHLDTLRTQQAVEEFDSLDHETKQTLAAKRIKLTQAKDTAALNLRRELYRGGYYFGGGVLLRIKDYIEWEKEHASPPESELPNETDLLQWRNAILASMREAL